MGILHSLKCHNCQHEGNDYTLRESGQHTEALCGKCGRHIKYVPKPDKYGTKEQRKQIWDKTHGRCCYCADALNPFDRNFTYEHVTAQANGGTHDDDNLMICCRSCNSSKGKKSLKEFREYRWITPDHNGRKYRVFYFEVVEYSSLGDLLKAMYSINR